MPINADGLLKFEGYELDRATWQLRFRDEVLPLSRKTFDLLIYLVGNADRVVTKDELLRALWPDSFVEENNLTQHIFLLRKALARHESGAKIIETVPGRGYRFVASVEVESGPDRSHPAPAGSGAGVAVGAETLRSLAMPGNIRSELDADSIHVRQADPTATVAVPPEGRRSPGWILTSPLGGWLFAATGVLLLVLYLAQSKTPAAQHVSGYQQITHDGHAKWLGGTDGSRIYFTQADRDEIAQVSVAGGTEAPMPIAIKVPRSGDVSPDGSTLLVVSQAEGQGPPSSLWSLQLTGGSYRRLGHAIAAAWSPNGEKIVGASAGGELYMMRSDGSDKHQIASPGGYIMWVAWSPDGKAIRFTKDGWLWQLSPEGRDLRRLLPGWGKSATQFNGAWSSDGRFFFVADGQIWMLERGRGLDGNQTPHPLQLTSGPMVWDRPLPALDGKRLFASGRIPRGELVRFDPKSARLEPFLGGISAEFVSFSRTNRSMAYVSYPDGRLSRANLDGSNPVQLTKAPFHPKSICWSPDGAQIAFVDRTENNVDAVFLIAADGTGKPLRLVPDDRQAETDPSWSPDGKQIAFATSPNIGASAKSDLRTFDLANGKTAVVPASDGLLVPRWSPDGRHLAAMTLDTEKLELFDLQSGRWTPLTTGHVAFPEWSHDGHWIYYIGWTPQAALMRIRAADGRREVITPLGAVRYTGTYTLWMGLDPVDSPMMLRDVGSDDIYALTLEDR